MSGGWDEFKVCVFVYGDLIEVMMEIRRGGDLYVCVMYVNGYEKVVGLKNLSANAVETYVRWLASEKGKFGSKLMKYRYFMKKLSV